MTTINLDPILAMVGLSYAAFIFGRIYENCTKPSREVLSMNKNGEKKWIKIEPCKEGFERMYIGNRYVDLEKPINRDILNRAIDRYCIYQTTFDLDVLRPL